MTLLLIEAETDTPHINGPDVEISLDSALNDADLQKFCFNFFKSDFDFYRRCMATLLFSGCFKFKQFIFTALLSQNLACPGSEF